MGMILTSDPGDHRNIDGGQRQHTRKVYKTYGFIQSEEEYKQQEKADKYRQESGEQSAEENDEGRFRETCAGREGGTGS